MIKKFLKEAIVLVVGKQAEEIADLLDSKKHVNEFIIAKKLGITINQTRNLLYKIANQGLVSSIRKKDKRKGWYTYFWKLENLKVLEFLRGVLIKRTEQLQNQIRSRESKNFYFCERCNIEFTEENALAYNFTCNECGNVFSIKDNKSVIKEFKKNLNKLQKELVLVNNEIKQEKEKVEKIKTKKLKKEKEIKAKERAKIAKKTKKAKKALKFKKKKIKKKKKKKIKKPKKKIKKKKQKKEKKKVKKKKIQRKTRKTKKISKTRRIKLKRAKKKIKKKVKKFKKFKKKNKKEKTK